MTCEKNAYFGELIFVQPIPQLKEMCYDDDDELIRSLSNVIIYYMLFGV